MPESFMLSGFLLKLISELQLTWNSTVYWRELTYLSKQSVYSFITLRHHVNKFIYCEIESVMAVLI